MELPYAMLGMAVLVLLLLKGVNQLLLWMDAKDWILIPNKEAVRNYDARLANFLLQAQQLAEPAKRHVVQERQAQELKRAEDEEGAGPPPEPEGPRR